MIIDGWQVAIIILFALLGVWTVVHWTVKGTKTLVGIIKDLATVLREAVDTAKEFRADFALVRQIAQSSPNFGVEPQAIPQREGPQEEEHPVEFPAPYLSRFPQKPFEEDAPPEATRDVDVTPTEEEITDQAKAEELLNMGIKAHPEDQ